MAQIGSNGIFAKLMMTLLVQKGTEITVWPKGYLALLLGVTYKLSQQTV